MLYKYGIPLQGWMYYMCVKTVHFVRKIKNVRFYNLMRLSYIC